MKGEIKNIVENCSMPVTETGCWLWERSKTNKGYGDFRFEGKNILAHRASYIGFVGPIPEGMQVCHRCDTPSCVNPNHLFIGTNLDNILDSVRKGRRLGITRRRPTGFKYQLRDPNAHDCKRKIKRCDFPEVVLEIIAGKKQGEIAKERGVHPSVVSRIWTRRK